MGILHQVQSRSGSSSADEGESGGLGIEGDMGNILSEKKETCQSLENCKATFLVVFPKAAPSARNFFFVDLPHPKKSML